MLTKTAECDQRFMKKRGSNWYRLGSKGQVITTEKEPMHKCGEAVLFEQRYSCEDRQCSGHGFHEFTLFRDGKKEFQSQYHAWCGQDYGQALPNLIHKILLRAKGELV